MLNKPNLDLSGKVGQFIDREDAAIGARQQAVVNCQLVGDVLPAARRLDRVDVSDHVCDGHVRSGELFDVPFDGREPRDRRLIAHFGDQAAALLADRVVGIVVNLAAGDVRNALIEQGGQHADQTRLGLAAQAEQDKVVPRQNRVDHLRHHRVLESHDAREQLFALLNLADQVRAKLVLDGAPRQPVFGKRRITAKIS